jgi:hypothetical protein
VVTTPCEKEQVVVEVIDDSARVLDHHTNAPPIRDFLVTGEGHGASGNVDRLGEVTVLMDGETSNRVDVGRCMAQVEHDSNEIAAVVEVQRSISLEDVDVIVLESSAVERSGVAFLHRKRLARRLRPLWATTQPQPVMSPQWLRPAG